MLEGAAHYIGAGLWAALTFLFAAFEPFMLRRSPLYWPFLVSTLVVAMLAWGLHSGAGWSSWRAFRRRHFGRALWWHSSARADYRYYLVNAVAFPLVVGPALFTGTALAGILREALEPLLGMPSASGAPGWAMKLAYTLVFFVAYDFGRFVAHCALHDVPVLWEFHKPHHSAEVLTPLTAFRAHPVELAVMAWGAAITTGIATWGFQWLAGTGIGYYQFLEMHVLLWGFSLLGNLKHWQVWISYGAVLNRWLISPAHHQLHHSAEARHFGANRGFELAIWDRLHGTLIVPQKEEAFRMGLGDGTDGCWHRVGRLYYWPLIQAARRITGRTATLEGAPVALRR
ncbi:MAG TPA: sterol desaturase family protein [Stellaceae bacterium]|nr:sterol desaturase family protein [Stellaceae bacterium]